MVETPGGKQTPDSKASKKLNDSKFGETIVEEVRSRYTAALSHLPDPASRLLQVQVSAAWGKSALRVGLHRGGAARPRGQSRGERLSQPLTSRRAASRSAPTTSPEEIGWPQCDGSLASVAALCIHGQR